jgi:hypothetical protein
VANQTLGPVRKEDERPLPAFKFGNELGTKKKKINKNINMVALKPQ